VKKKVKRKKSAGEYLAFLSAKYEVAPDTFFCALLSAGENRKSSCGNLSIECRGKIKDRIIFLITDDSQVVAQLSVSETFLKKEGNPIRTFMGTDMVRKHEAKKTKSPISCSIQDLRAGMNHVNLKAKVLEVTQPKQVFTRYGNYASLAKAVIADGTGKIKLCLWNDQIDAVSTGATVKIENARTSTFRGERQLSLGKNGTVSNVERFGDEMVSTDLQQQSPSG
jgi:replication factor A1